MDSTSATAAGSSSSAGQVITCRAAVSWEAGRALELETIQVEPPQAGEVRVRICFTSPCHTDVVYQHENVGAFPRILGHEASGIVESVGAEVTEFAPGDHVIPNFMGTCAKCALCTDKRSNLCMQTVGTIRGGVMLADNRTRFSKDGRPIYHFMSCSTFSEYTVVNQHFLTKISPTGPLDTVCVLGCGVTTGLGSALKIAAVTSGSSVAVFGLGTIGLAAVEGARIAGASKIIAVDINPAKLALAKDFGATDFLNPTDCGGAIHEVIQGITGGGADYCFECVGDVNVMNSAFESSHFVYGTTVIIGVAKEGSSVPLSPHSILLGRSLKSGLFGGYRGKKELSDLVEQVSESKELGVDLSRYITHRLPFSQINEALQLLNEGKALRCVLTLEASSSN